MKRTFLCTLDSCPGLCTAIEYYSLPLANVVGTSVPAAEHSTITSWTKAGRGSHPVLPFVVLDL